MNGGTIDANANAFACLLACRYGLYCTMIALLSFPRYAYLKPKMQFPPKTDNDGEGEG